MIYFEPNNIKPGGVCDFCEHCEGDVYEVDVLPEFDSQGSYSVAICEDCAKHIYHGLLENRVSVLEASQANMAVELQKLRDFLVV